MKPMAQSPELPLRSRVTRWTLTQQAGWALPACRGPQAHDLLLHCTHSDSMAPESRVQRAAQRLSSSVRSLAGQAALGASPAAGMGTCLRPSSLGPVLFLLLKRETLNCPVQGTLLSYRGHMGTISEKTNRALNWLPSTQMCFPSRGRRGWLLRWWMTAFVSLPCPYLLDVTNCRKGNLSLAPGPGQPKSFLMAESCAKKIPLQSRPVSPVSQKFCSTE